LLESLGTGLSLGLATGTACLASCGPIYASYLMGEKRSGLQSLWVILKLNAGRFVAYAIFGLIVGLLGGAVPVSVRIPLALSGYIFFSVYLLLSVVRVRKTCTGCHAGKFLKITKSSFLLGILTGFSICPAFLIALTGAFESSGPINGMMLFIGFFTGTTVYMLPFAIFGLLTTKTWITKAARIMAVMVAIYFGAMGIRGLARWIMQPQLRADSQGNAVQNSEITEEERASIFAVEDADTLYLITFSDDPDDVGNLFARDYEQGALPPLSLLEITQQQWRTTLDGLPELSAVIVPSWVDSRYGKPLEPWQDSIASRVQEMRFRTFAVEYQPYCSERASGIQTFLETYSFRCPPDSGFTFLMLNPLGCSPSQCSDCDISH